MNLGHSELLSRSSDNTTGVAAEAAVASMNLEIGVSQRDLRTFRLTGTPTFVEVSVVHEAHARREEAVSCQEDALLCRAAISLST